MYTEYHLIMTRTSQFGFVRRKNLGFRIFWHVCFIIWIMLLQYRKFIILFIFSVQVSQWKHKGIYCVSLVESGACLEKV